MFENKRKTPITTRRKGKNRINERLITSESVNHTPKLLIKDALELFVNAKKAEGMRERTIYDYYKHMEWFKRFLSEYHPHVTAIQDLTPEVV